MDMKTSDNSTSNAPSNIYINGLVWCVGDVPSPSEPSICVLQTSDAYPPVVLLGDTGEWQPNSQKYIGPVDPDGIWAPVTGKWCIIPIQAITPQISQYLHQAVKECKPYMRAYKPHEGKILVQYSLYLHVYEHPEEGIYDVRVPFIGGKPAYCDTLDQVDLALHATIKSLCYYAQVEGGGLNYELQKLQQAYDKSIEILTSDTIWLHRTGVIEVDCLADASFTLVHTGI